MSSDDDKDELPETNMEGQYTTVRETADSMHISTGKLREWIDKGWIKAIRPGGKRGRLWVSIQSVKEFLNRHTIGKKPNGE